MKLPKEGNGEPLLLIGIHVFLFVSEKRTIETFASQVIEKRYI
ncbi:hypothetical protein [Enterococcus italicus]|nr:hypothetical protein [Enterococcus italicus]